MKLQVNPNGWSCLAAAFSMALGMPVAQFIEMAGHDGSDQPYTDKQFHLGFHIQECIDICFQLGFACTEIQAYFGLQPDSYIKAVPVLSVEVARQRFGEYLQHTNCGVLTGVGKHLGHAVAWDGTFIYDPRSPGYIYPLEEAENHNFHPQTLWILTKMEFDNVKTSMEG